MAKRIESLKIIDKLQLTKEIFVLELTGRDKLPEMLPGQFVEIKVEGTSDTFLRRPFSVHDVNYGQNTLKLLIQISGKGTQRLSELGKGDYLDMVYPLGNSFSLPAGEQKILLAGGGCGVAPLLYLGKYLRTNGYNPDVLLGFRNSERIIEYNEYLNIGKVYLTTEDGSSGEKGFVTDHSVLKSETYEKVYCCGPEPMMKAVASFCRDSRIDCEVSLENLMGCGIGACLCCVVPTVKGNLCTCTDGPVFNIKDLKW